MLLCVCLELRAEAAPPNRSRSVGRFGGYWPGGGVMGGQVAEWQGGQGPSPLSCNDLHEPPGCRTGLGLGEERREAGQGRAVASRAGRASKLGKQIKQPVPAAIHTEAKGQSMINTMNYARTCRPCPQNPASR